VHPPVCAEVPLCPYSSAAILAPAIRVPDQHRRQADQVSQVQQPGGPSRRRNQLLSRRCGGRAQPAAETVKNTVPRCRTEAAALRPNPRRPDQDARAGPELEPVSEAAPEDVETPRTRPAAARETP